MDFRDIEQLLVAGQITNTIKDGDLFLLARPNSQRGDKYSVLIFEETVLADFISSKSSPTGIVLLGKLIGFDMNSTLDQPIVLSGGAKFIIKDVVLTNASLSLNVASDFEIWSGTGRTGAQIQYNPNLGALTSPTKYDDGLISANGGDLIGNTLYASLGTPQGSPATADLYVYGYSVG